MATAEAIEPTFTVRVPSGYEVAFYAGDGTVKNPRHYRIDGQRVPGVTEILDCLAKDLSWWGQDVGVQGVLALWEKRLLARATDGRLAVVHPADNVWAIATPEIVVEQLKLQKLSTSYVVSRAGDRGQAAHDALEAWAVSGELPSAENYPPPEQPYIRAVRRFCEDIGPAWKTHSTEVTVGSVDHGFAGRYDLRGEVVRPVQLVSQALRKDGSAVLKGGFKRVDIPAGTKLLCDLKTTKRVYTTHLLQLAGYELASVESGMQPTDMRMVIHATAFGEYEVHRTAVHGSHFLAVRHVYEVMESLRV